MIQLGTIALLALAAMTIAQPVVANTCEFEYPENQVEAAEGDDAAFKISVRCQSAIWSSATFRYMYRTSGGSADSPDDYTFNAGNHVFSQTNSSADRVVTVETKDDDECEGDERFKVIYKLEGVEHGIWVDWSTGRLGLPGRVAIGAEIEDQTAGC